jgi:23S rRNA (cytidine1920-2'-O)/16S rRNA (cytidine1409-2'-O)-methyltransferase
VASRRPLLDLISTELPGLTREQCLSRILCGEVLVNGGVIRDPKHSTTDSDNIEFTTSQFVGRGGEKLEAALNSWDLDVAGKVLVDVGSSTGGFTDCLLQRGVLTVHAIDVGTNQLAYRLRTDARVCVHEQTNILAVSALDPVPDAAVADLSFRSLRGVARSILDLTTEGWAILLIKPQFEWAQPGPEFTGVVPHVEVEPILERVLIDLADEGAVPVRLMRSPVLGRRGNTEFLAYVAKDATADLSPADLVRALK